MYIITTYNNRYKLYQKVPGMSGMYKAVYVMGMANYSVGILLEVISIHNPTDIVFSSSGVMYFIEYLPVVIAVDSWSELREEVNNLAILDAL